MQNEKGDPIYESPFSDLGLVLPNAISISISIKKDYISRHHFSGNSPTIHGESKKSAFCGILLRYI